MPAEGQDHSLAPRRSTRPRYENINRGEVLTLNEVAQVRAQRSNGV